MVRVHTKIPSWCFRISKAPPLQFNPAYNFIKVSHKNDHYDENDFGSSFNSEMPRSSEENFEKGESMEVQVEVVALAGKASLLVLGHRKRSKAWRLWMRWTGRNRGSHSVVDHCIQNAECHTIAVRGKSRILGGYLITTKRHENFWLLA